MSEDKYCIEYTIIDFPMASSFPSFYEKAGYNLTKEEADAEAKRLNDEDDTRIEQLKLAGEPTYIYFNYYSKKVN